LIKNQKSRSSPESLAGQTLEPSTALVEIDDQVWKGYLVFLDKLPRRKLIATVE